MREQSFDVNRDALRLMDCLRPMGAERAFSVGFELIFHAWRSARGDVDVPDWRLLTDGESASFIDQLLDGPDALSVLKRFYGTLTDQALREALSTIDGYRTRLGADGLRELSESLLASQLAVGGRGSAAHASPLWLAELTSALVGPASIAVDPTCGLGSMLLSMSRRGSRVVGFDVSEEALGIARARLVMHAAAFTLQQLDSVATASVLPQQVDAVVGAPPFALKFDAAQRDGLEAAGLPRSVRTGKATRGGLHWVALASQMLASTGRAAIVLPPSAAWASEALEELIERRMVEGVIALPGGSLPDTSIPCDVWLVTPEGAGPPSLLVADITSYATVDDRRKRASYSPEAIEVVAAIVNRFRSNTRLDVPEYVARVIPLGERQAEDGLSPRRVLEEAPPLPEVVPEPSGHLLNSLSVSGYKSFSDETEVPLAALTLVYGPNSSGKSSLIQSLLLLKQSIDSDHLVAQGPLSDVGSFSGVRSKHEAPAIEFGVEFGAPVWDLPSGGTPDPVHKRRLGFRFTDRGDGRGRLEVAHVEAGPLETQWTWESANTMSTPSSSLGDAFAEIATGVFLFGRDSRQIRVDDADRDPQRRRGGRSQARFLKAQGVDDLRVDWLGLLPSGRPPKLPSHIGTERAVSTAQSYVDRLSRLMAGVGEEFRSLLGDLVYLGPLRSAPQRFYSRAGGSTQPGDGRDAFLFLYDNTSAVEQVNTWFKELEIPYEVAIVPLLAATARGLVGDLVAVSLRDLRSDVIVSPADVGYGVSQSIPIVVELTARTRSIVCIEQPETHLHPRLQARLADLFIDATNPEGRANQLIVETHSEHLMLRVQRRIREHDLDAGDVCVLYVDQMDDGSARVQRLRLDEDGDFLDEWPDGFFDERMDDLFGELL